MNHSHFFRIYFDVNAVNEKEELLPAVKGATLGYFDIHTLILTNFHLFSTESANTANFLVFLALFFSLSFHFLLLSVGFIADSSLVIRHVLNESLLRRNLSISQLAIYELPGTSDLSKCKWNSVFFYVIITRGCITSIFDSLSKMLSISCTPPFQYFKSNGLRIHKYSSRIRDVKKDFSEIIRKAPEMGLCSDYEKLD